MKCDVLSRGKGGAGDDSGRICNLCMTRIEFRGKFRDSERAVISLIWGRRGRIIKIQSVRDIEEKDLAPGVEKAPF